MPQAGYDFAGWVTKADTLCSDGLIIKQDAFKDCDGKKVPLVWNHDYTNPDNVLGHVVLHSKSNGVYGYGYFNENEMSQNAREMLKHGDITSMSIGARKLKKVGKAVMHGMIYEVSLVLAGANPGAFIDQIVTHSENDDELESAVIYAGNIIHSADSLPDDEEEEGGEKVEDNDLQHADKTIGDILDTLNDEQMRAVEALIGNIVDEDEDDDENNEDGDDQGMKHNVFEGTKDETLQHADLQTVMQSALQTGSFKEAMLKHGITDIETLFPEAHLLDKKPRIWRDEKTGAAGIVNGTTKSPFSRIKTRGADLTEDEARARGYIKGNQKIEQIFSLFSRETTPQTIYKKQKLDRDDIIDITDFDVVSFINEEMKVMLIEELGRAILVGDGRVVSDASKIKEDKIRPIISDDDFYTLKKTFTDETDFVEKVVLGMIDYKGTGGAVGYIDPQLLAKIKLLKGTDGRWLSGHIPTDAEIATQLGLSRLEPTTMMAGKGMLAVNLKDYVVGATKGGEVTTFDDFDIDFNQYKYLIETRVSGALTLPHSAIHFNPTEEEEVTDPEA